ncbi:hypothetical protein ACROYT_G032507 [Oculina patagonica]
MPWRKNSMLVYALLFSLLYSVTRGQRKDSGWQKLKATLNKHKKVGSDDAMTAGRSVDAGKAFLTNLYNNYFNENGEMKTTNTAISEIVHSVQGNVDVKTNVIRFNMKEINPKEYIQKAEIHVKVVHSANKDQNASHAVNLGLYDKMTGELISQTILLGTEPAWKVFMVRTAVVRWLRSPYTNHGVQVEIMTDSGKRKPVPKVLMNGDRSGPFLVVYTDGRRLQGVEGSAFLRDRIRRDSKTKTNSTAALVPTSDLATLCSRHDLHINSKHIFGHLIIAPLSFNAYDCAGTCDMTAAPGSFSNHAIVRLTAAQHWVRGENVTAPCCVPTNFSSLLGVLYASKDGHVVLRQYKNMVATECGCR